MQHDPLPDMPLPPGDSDGPVFREPWEASAFAMVVSLNQAGHFTWSEWVECLSQEIKRAEMGPVASGHDGEGYYHAWFAALEKLILAKNMLDGDSIDGKHRYLRENPVPHDHVARREPVRIA